MPFDIRGRHKGAVTTDLFSYGIIRQSSAGSCEPLTAMQSVLPGTQQMTRSLVASRGRLSTQSYELRLGLIAEVTL